MTYDLRLKIKLAKVISRIFDPVFEGPILVWLATQLGETKLSWQYTFLLSLLFIYLLPIIVFFVSLKVGWIADWDTTQRKQRYGLFIFTFCSIVLCLIIFYLLNEKALFYLYLKILLPVLIFFIITFFYKISGHTLVNTIFVQLLYFYFNKSIILYMGFFIVILIGWSRIVLKKHKFWQVVAGALLPLLTLAL